MWLLPNLNPDRSSCAPAAAAAAAENDGGLKVQEIDAYWLQRRISQTLTDLDAAAAQQLAQEVLEALQVCELTLSCCCVGALSCACGQVHAQERNECRYRVTNCQLSWPRQGTL